MDEATRSQLNRSMAALADGDRRAFDLVYRTLWPVLTELIAVISADRMIAEDIAQQAMLKILARVSTFDPCKDALAWSMTIAVNEYRSYRRKLGHHTVAIVAGDLPEPIDHNTPEAIAIRNNLVDAAKTILGKLRPQELEIIVAAIYEAERPALTAAAFRKRLQRVLAHTRLIWKRYYGDDRTG